MQLDLSQLSCLEELKTAVSLKDNSLLPAQLQRLHMFTVAASTLSPVTRLQHLQQLSLEVSFKDHRLLLPLAQLQALTMLEVEYLEAAAAVRTAVAWRALPRLHQLCLYIEDSELLTVDEFAGVLAAAAACSSITSLTLHSTYGQGEHDVDGQRAIPVFSQLAGMTGLRELCVRSWRQMTPGEVTALSTLAGLTGLALTFQEEAQLQDFDVALLVGSLQQLRNLDLSQNRLSSMVCLASIAQLTQLTRLSLDGNPGVTAQGVMALTRLTGLQHLSVDKNAQVTDELLSKFWTAVKSRRCH
jgi:hypothetical protein